jgi:pimeloyl-ACP methyl ester carboxylesterase
MASVTEGFVAFRGFRTWWRRYAPPDGAEGRVPLIAVHGGPGMPWVLDDSALELAGHLGRPVVFYHQVGCGRSDRPDDPSLWSVEFFVDELANLRRELSLDDVHIYGISWGGMLALAYLLTQPAGVRGVVLASAIPSVPLFEQEARRLVDGMPAAVRGVLRRARPAPGSEHRGIGQVLPGLTEREIEAKGRQLAKMLPLFDNPLATGAAWFGSWLPALRPTATQIAELAYARRHICRLDPLPPAAVGMMAAANPELYEVMWGPVECQPTGLLKDFDVTDRLSEIRVPALVISGAADEVTPVQSKLLADRLPDARWVLFQHSSHSAILEEPDLHWSLVHDFLDQVDTRLSTATPP